MTVFETCTIKLLLIWYKSVISELINQ